MTHTPPLIRFVLSGDPYWHAVEGGVARTQAATDGLPIEMPGGGVFPPEADVVGALAALGVRRAEATQEEAPAPADPDDPVLDLHGGEDVGW